MRAALRRPAVVAVGLGMVLSGSAGPVHSALHPVGQLGGMCTTVTVAGAAVYAGFGATLTRFPTANPPVRSGWELMGGEGFVRDIAVVGQTAFVAQDGGGVRVVGLGTALGESGWATGGVDHAYGLAAADGYLYVAVRDFGLRVLDVSLPTAPSEVGALAVPGGTASTWDVAVADGYAYLATGGTGIWIVDVSDPSHPAHVGFLDTGNVYDVAVTGSWVLAASGTAGLSACEIIVPGSLVERDSLPTAHDARGVAVDGTVAWVAADDLYAVDLTDPTNLQSLGSCVVPGGAVAVAAAGGDAWVGASSRGLYTARLPTSVGPPALLGAYDPLSDALAVEVVGSYAWVAAGQHGLRAVSVASPSAPFVAAAYDTGDYWAWDVAMKDGLALVGESHGNAWDGALEAVSLAAFPTLTQAGFYHALAAPVYALAEADGLAYLAVADTQDGVRVVDVDPVSLTAWTEVGDCSSWWTGAYPRSIVLEAGLLLAGTDLSGVQVADLAIPTAPAWATDFQTVATLYDVAAWGRYVYAREAQGSTVRVLTLDLVDPASPAYPPVWLETYVPTGSAGSSGCCRGGLHRSGDILYAAFDLWGVRALSLAVPSAPVEVAAFDTPLPTTSVSSAGSLVYVGMEAGGLLILVHDLFSSGFEDGGLGDWSRVVGGGA